MEKIAYRYRLYPTDEQKVFFLKNFGCCRFIWNHMLADKKQYYKETGKMLYNRPAQYKKEFPFLKEVDSLALTNTQLDLEEAYRRFFAKGNGFPKFKSKKTCRRSYTTNNQKGTVRVSPAGIKLPKIGKVKAVIHQSAPDTCELKSATISQEADGSFYCSVLYTYTELITPVQMEKAVGLDYKSDGLYCSSDNEICGSPRFYRKAQRRLAKQQRILSRKQKGSSNRNKQKQKVARIHRHVANQRLDYLHKESTKIANSYDLVCIEDLNMRAMANHGFHNGKATLDNGWGLFTEMLKYKLHRRGKYLIRINRFFPSSQRCHCCGNIYPLVKDLSIRQWKCPVCGENHDRDLNAAINIREEGIRIYYCG